MNYSLRELECFTAVAEELSFTRAARKLHLAQPPLSRHVRMLEEKLGAPLFTRANRKVALTSAGALFYEETRTVLPQLLHAGEATRRFASGETVSL
ncbi:MAG TPA: LysR family transcriptional regulator, partial [Rariglobus sp.]